MVALTQGLAGVWLLTRGSGGGVPNGVRGGAPRRKKGHFYIKFKDFSYFQAHRLDQCRPHFHHFSPWCRPGNGVSEKACHDRPGVLSSNCKGVPPLHPPSTHRRCEVESPFCVRGRPQGGSIGRVVSTLMFVAGMRTVGRSVGSTRLGCDRTSAARWVGRSGRSGWLNKLLLFCQFFC